MKIASQALASAIILVNAHAADWINHRDVQARQAPSISGAAHPPKAAITILPHVSSPPKAVTTSPPPKAVTTSPSASLDAAGAKSAFSSLLSNIASRFPIETKAKKSNQTLATSQTATVTATQIHPATLGKDGTATVTVVVTATAGSLFGGAGAQGGLFGLQYSAVVSLASHLGNELKATRESDKKDAKATPGAGQAKSVAPAANGISKTSTAWSWGSGSGSGSSGSGFAFSFSGPIQTAAATKSAALPPPPSLPPSPAETAITEIIPRLITSPVVAEVPAFATEVFGR